MCVLKYKDQLQMWHVDANINLSKTQIQWDDIQSKGTSPSGHISRVKKIMNMQEMDVVKQACEK